MSGLPESSFLKRLIIVFHNLIYKSFRYHAFFKQFVAVYG